MSRYEEMLRAGTKMCLFLCREMLASTSRSPCIARKMRSQLQTQPPEATPLIPASLAFIAQPSALSPQPSAPSPDP
eukprot:2862645-Rhodomonas_salina.1